MEQAERIRPETSISPNPLAIIAVGRDAHKVGRRISIPAYRADGTPLLVPAAIIQCGDQPVEYKVAVPKAEATTIAATTLEIIIDRQAMEKNQWDQTATPLNYLGIHIPEMRGSDRILATWSLKTYQERKMVALQKATHWHGFTRVPDTALESILKRSGQQGIFINPKDKDKRPDPRFAVVPVPGAKLQEVSAKAAGAHDAMGVAMLTQNNPTYAIRCRRERLPHLREALYPESAHVEAADMEDDDQAYILRHVNQHFTREKLTEALQQTGWSTVRAIRPTGGDAWLLGAKEPPQHGHVCINGAIATVTASKKTTTIPVVMTRSLNITMVHTTPQGAVSVTKQARVDEIRADVKTEVEALVEQRLASTETKMQQLQTRLEETQNQLADAQRQTQKDLMILKQDHDKVGHQVAAVEQTVTTGNLDLIRQMMSMMAKMNQDNQEHLETMRKAMTQQIGSMQTTLHERMDAMEKDREYPTPDLAAKRHKHKPTTPQKQTLEPGS